MRPLCCLTIGVAELAADRLQGERPFLVRPHQPRIPRVIGGEDRGEAALDPLCAQGPLRSGDAPGERRSIARPQSPRWAQNDQPIPVPPIAPTAPLKLPYLHGSPTCGPA